MIVSEEKRAKWRKANRDWYKRNAESVGARTSAYAKGRTKQNSSYCKKWREKNIERFRALQRKYKGVPEPTRPRPESCECCGGPPTGRGGLNVDHCHKTKKFRGWLCWNCNTSIGRLGDDIAGLERAMNYLKRNAPQETD